ncbi:MAG: IS5 family transposase [Pseudomonadota bacterium]
MSELFWLSEAQVDRMRPYFPKARGVARVDDRRVLSGIIYVQKHGLMWKDAPAAYGRPKTLYNRWKRWSRLGVFARIMTELSGEARDLEGVMIDATHLKAHRTASSMGRSKGGRGRLIGRTKGGLNSKLHVLSDAKGRPISMFLTAGQRSDYTGARAMLASIPEAGTLIADRGYDADWFREALQDKGIAPCIPSRKSRKTPIPHDAALYRMRHKIENAFARIKDWRRIATRYDRCPVLFLSACALAVTVTYWL